MRSLRLATLALGAVFVAAPVRVHATVESDGGPAPSFLKVAGGKVFFARYDASEGGWALWTTDGTPGGTIVLRTALGLDVELVPVGDRLVFSTRGALWTSDGTAEGTVVVADLPFYPNGIKRVGDVVFFSDGRGQLWRSDLTTPGTAMVKDIPPGYLFHDLTPAAITNVNGTVFFRAVDFEHGSELWTSDGTPDGTVPLDINPYAGSAPGYLASTGTLLLCSADDGIHGYELVRSDGTPGGTALVRDINPTGDAWPRNLRVIGDTAFMSADDGTGAELWRSDGTEAGTIRVKDINPTGGSFPNALVNVAGVLYFRADDGTHGLELWKSDGTEAGTTLVRDVNPSGSSVPANLRNVQGRLFFTADDGVHGDELWASDGTADGTVMAADLNPNGGSYAHAIVNVGGVLYLAADDGTNGTQLWKVDCTGAGGTCKPTVIPLPSSPRQAGGVPFLVKDVNPGPGDGEPYYLTNIGGTLFFQAFRPDTGVELWKSDGTDAGTTLVRDIEPGPADSDPYDFTDVDGVAYFVAYASWTGSELWRSDGTEAGTQLVKDLVPGWGSSYPTNLTPFEGKLFFSASNESGQWLWKTDGTDAGTEIVSGPANEIATLGDSLYYIASAPPEGQLEPLSALWRSDGTQSAVLHPFFHHASGNPRLHQLVAAGSFLFFRAEGGELWRSDGTADGTIALTPDGVNPQELTPVGDVLYFSGTSIGAGRELWRSDGTPEGTFAVADINPGPADGMPGRLTDVNGTLFFWAADGTTGFELWKSDGTAPGTVLVRDIDPTDVTVPSYFQAVGDLLYFTAQNPSFGYELWRSDGTTDGTAIVRNLNLVRSSYPESPANVGGTLFFYADDGRFGDELWALTPCGNGSLEPGEECDDGNLDHGDGCNERCRLEPIPTTSSTTTTTTSTEPATSTVPATSTTTLGATTTVPVTTTTALAPPTTTSSTLPPEDCGNCIDDDGDGLVDLEDPACCAASGSLAVGQLRVTPHGGRSTLVLKGALGGVALPGAGAPDVVVQLRRGGDAPWCARIPAERLRVSKRGLRFDDPTATIAGTGGLTRLRLLRAKGGAPVLVLGGAATSFVAAPGAVDVAVALVTPSGTATCASSTATLRPARRGGRRALAH